MNQLKSIDAKCINRESVQTIQIIEEEPFKVRTVVRRRLLDEAKVRKIAVTNLYNSSDISSDQRNFWSDKGIEWSENVWCLAIISLSGLLNWEERSWYIYVNINIFASSAWNRQLH